MEDINLFIILNNPVEISSEIAPGLTSSIGFMFRKLKMSLVKLFILLFIEI